MNIPDQNDSLLSIDSDDVGLPPIPPAIEAHAFNTPVAPSLLVRSFRLFFRSVKDAFAFFTSAVVVPFFKMISSFSGGTYLKLREEAHKKEVAINEYVTKIETKLDVKEAKARIKEIESVGMTQEYETKLRRFFDDGVCSVVLEAHEVTPANAPKSLSFSADLFQYMAMKLKESALGTNVEYMTITTSVEKLKITHVVEFELKTLGQNWAAIFAKYIGKDVFHKIEWAGGVVDGHHTHNATLMRDTFVFAFSHERMELLETISPSKTHKAEINQDM